MRENVEKRLHRVKIEPSQEDVSCPHSGFCRKAQNCLRCNEFYRKCHLFLNLEELDEDNYYKFE